MVGIDEGKTGIVGAPVLEGYEVGQIVMRGDKDGKFGTIEGKDVGIAG